ncbi:unnamed protein product [Rangifer tarandus platyrhynchus]|uniref:Uncharacterized protein n=1 Tax=Rangifer tarandus platyrhynchus TaxID=3082113 RepID=A0AC59Y0N6_RANTA
MPPMSLFLGQARPFCTNFPWFCRFFGPPPANLQSKGSDGAGTLGGVLMYFPLKWMMMASHFSVDSILAKPTPLLAPLVSRRIRVETTWPKGCSIPSSSCSSTDSGRFEMYKFVGSCSCCFAICVCTPLAFSTVTALCAAEGLSKSTKP